MSDWPLLTIVTFLPLVGVIFILLVYFFPAGIAGTLLGKGGHK